MRVLIINTSDITGGAAVAASRLMEALNCNGVKAKMLVRDKLSADISVARCPATGPRKWPFLLERLAIWLRTRLPRRRLFGIDTASSGLDITATREFAEADIIHLHWINQGYVSLAGLRRIISSGKPIVWTLHDAWPATALCHYTRGCTAFESHCRACPQADSRAADSTDYATAAATGQGKKPNSGLAASVWRKKQALYRGSGIRFVACSRWLQAEAQKSALLTGLTVEAIPNTINQKVFRPMDRREARRIAGLPLEGQIILFVSQRTDDPRKGADHFRKAVETVAHTLSATADSADQGQRVTVAVLGGTAGRTADSLALPATALGYVSEPHRIAATYAAADVFVLPSLEDNLPNTIMEAMACGTPCVAFATGGIPEMIDHKANGYVARQRDTDDLARGIIWTLREADRQALSAAAVRKVTTTYSQHTVAMRYIEEYEKAKNLRRIRS